MPRGHLVSLLALDPELGQLVPAERMDQAHAELVVRLSRITSGAWDAGQLADASPEHLGLLLLDGVVAREVLVSDIVSTELLGPGDVVRPWTIPETERLLSYDVRWNALADSRIAILDRNFAARLARWPEINAILIDRVAQRAQRLATTQAISQLTRVDRRVLALFWHLAERWGRVTGAGVVVPLALPHRMVGQLIGARRPTVSTAIGRLAKRRELVRRPDGTWLLMGEPIATPAPDVDPFVPLRRRLLPDDAAREPAVERERPSSSAVEPNATAVVGLRAALSQLREEHPAQISDLDEVSARVERLIVDLIEALNARSQT